MSKSLERVAANVHKILSRLLLKSKDNRLHQVVIKRIDSRQRFWSCQSFCYQLDDG